MTGTVEAAPNVGVTANGRLAALDRSAAPITFSVVVPLVPGDNLITVTGTTQAGETDTQTVTVTRTGNATIPYTVTVTPTRGAAPLEVSFQVSTDDAFANPVYTIHVDFDGDGRVDAEVANVDLTDPTLPVLVLTPLDLSIPVTHTYPDPGVYPAVIWVNNLSLVDSQFTQTGERFEVVIEVLDENALDDLFTNMWEGMNARLLSGDVNGALAYIVEGARDKYQGVFEKLLSDMPAIIGSYSMLRRAAVLPGMGEYTIVRETSGEKRLFLIYFVQDEQGVWWLSAM